VKLLDRDGVVWTSAQPPKDIHPARHWTDGDRWVTRKYLDTFRGPVSDL